MGELEVCVRCLTWLIVSFRALLAPMASKATR